MTVSDLVLGKPGEAGRGRRMTRGARFTVAATAAFACLGLAIFGWAVAQQAVCEPILDMIPVLADWLDGSDGLPETLWHPLNEHHLVWTRLLTPADFVLSGGWPWLSGTISVLLLACLAGVPARALLRTALPREVRWAGVAVLILLVFAAPAAEETAIVINGVYPQAAGFAMLSLGFAATGRWRLAFATAILAALGNGVGLVLFLILPWQAWRGAEPAQSPHRARNLPGSTVWLLALAGMAFILLYLRGVPTQPHKLPQVSVGMRYAAAMLGLPLSHSSGFGWLGTGLGGSLGLLGLGALLRRPRSELERLAQGGVLFGLGVAALGALGRTDIAGGLPAVRYAALVLPLQIGLLCLALPAALRWLRPLSVTLLLLLLGIGLCGVSALAARATVSALAASRAAVARFAAGERDPALEPYVYPDLQEAARIWAKLAARGLPVCRQTGH